MTRLIRTMPWRDADDSDLESLLAREWLVTNGLGGYASGTVAGACTRRYHGLLVAALRAPFGRTVMLNHLAEDLELPGDRIAPLGGHEREGSLQLPGAEHLSEFRLAAGLPVWRYEIDGTVLEKRLLMPHMQNTVHITYRLLAGEGPVRLFLRPSVHFRPHESAVSVPLAQPYTVKAMGPCYELEAADDHPPLRLRLVGRRPVLILSRSHVRDLFYRIEAERGYDAHGDLWTPGFFRVDLSRDRAATLVASTEPRETMLALSPKQASRAERRRRRLLLAAAPEPARTGPAAELVLAADQFLIAPAGRVANTALAHATGDEVRTIIAGYHWFTDWGRDTMISLDGLTLATGRHQEAGYILRTFAHYIRDGLLPNMFPEHENEGLYHTADATLWFFHAIDRYLEVTGDRASLRLLLPKLQSIVDRHRRGTRFGIGVDPQDGLLRQGQEGYQLTWMDAKVEDWVVTPRRGKAVEINALWYNALRLLEGWLRDEQRGAEARPLAELADQVYATFNARFWYEEGSYLFDVVDSEEGDDPSCRPNQVLAIAPRHPVLDPARWPAVLDVVRQNLLTPVGLRSLAPGHPDYKPRYYGDLRARDAAYHQGTVWPWLIGPFIDAWLKAHPEDRDSARRWLEGLIAHLDEACLGSISEICDAEPPFTPRGCIAQAWSIAEVLRSWLKTAEEPPGPKAQPSP